jgi:hypothetical protein
MVEKSFADRMHRLLALHAMTAAGWLAETTNSLLLSHSAGSTIRRLVGRPRQADAAKPTPSCGLAVLRAHYGLQEAWNRLVAATR